MKKVLILHGLDHHWSMICSYLSYFQDYEIDLLFPPEVKPHRNPCERFDGWSDMCDRMNLKYNVISKIKPNQKYDYCLLGTDNDTLSCSYYQRYVNGIPILVINHERGVTRDSIDPKYKRQLWVLGSHIPLQDSYFFGCRYLNIDEKMRLLTPRISVVIIGSPSREIWNSPQSLERHIINFGDIDFHIINREIPETYSTKYTNIKYLASCSTLQMNYIISQSHYVWFYSPDRIKCTGCVHMAYTMLCRCILHNASKNQYGIQTPIYGGEEDRFVLPPLTRQDVTSVSNERDYLIEQTQQAIRRRLIGDPIICQG